MIALIAHFFLVPTSVISDLPTLNVYDPATIAKKIETSGSSDVIYELVEAGDPKKTVFALISVSSMFARSEKAERFPEVYQKAISAITEIEGHARFFSDQIRELSEESRSARSRERRFGLFSKVGSRECVIELASFLDDHYVNPRDLELLERMGPEGHTFPIASNSMLAVRTLSKMSLQGAPTSGQVYGTDEIDLWTEWWKANKERYLTKPNPSPLANTPLQPNPREAAGARPKREASTTFLLLFLAVLIAIAAFTVWWLRTRRGANRQTSPLS